METCRYMFKVFQGDSYNSQMKGFDDFFFTLQIDTHKAEGLSYKNF